jgi:hypothetical protein
VIRRAHRGAKGGHGGSDATDQSNRRDRPFARISTNRVARIFSPTIIEPFDLDNTIRRIRDLVAMLT